MSNESKGTVKWYNDKKGFGFLQPDNGGNDIFVHVTGIANGQPLKEGASVSYELKPDRQGRMNAVNVRAA